MSATSINMYEGRDLEAMSFARNYHAWIRDEFLPFVRGRVVEIGAGSGEFSRLLLEGELQSLTAVEPSENLLPLLKGVLADDRRSSTFHGFTSEFAEYSEREAFDTAVYVNVLEHIEDDRSELEAVHRILCEGGHLCLFVPALPWLYSDFDRSVGHFRRYTRQGLLDVLEDTGFVPVRIRYFDFAGIVPWLVAFVLFRRSFGAQKVSLYDSYVVPLMRYVEDRVDVPIGKNLLVVACKA